MDNLEEKARRITLELNIKTGNLNNTIQTVEDRIFLRFDGIEDKKEAIELVKYWISSEENAQENWDVAFLLSRYRLDDTSIIEDLAQKFLGIKTENKSELYEIFGVLSVRYAEFEVRRRLLRYYRKAYATRTFFKKSEQTIKVDNVQETIDVRSYFILLKQDLQHLEDKFRIKIAHEKEAKKLEKAWNDYEKYLSITYYTILMSETENTLISILENISRIPHSSSMLEEFSSRLKKINLALYEKFTVTDYHLYFFYVTLILKTSSNEKDKRVRSSLIQANRWLEEYEMIEASLKKLTIKDAKELDCLKIFFPDVLVDFFNLNEADGKRYELTVLFRNSIKNVDKSTQIRRIHGTKKRAEFLKSKKDATKNSGEKIYKKMIKGNSIKKIAESYDISRETAYKQLYVFIFYKYKYEKKHYSSENIQSEEYFMEYFCEKYKLKKKLLLNAIKKCQ